LITRYTRKTPESKRLTQRNRRVFCDPRSVSGFRTFWKEMVYPIVTTRSEGARFWDIDGNEYIDVTMGFGTNLLGHAPPFIAKALEEQLKKGIEVGPQSPLAGSVAQLICELTGHERAAFCNTGSEAVLAAIRVARTVTGRSRIATTGGFHGICDEVLVRANVVGGKRTTVPVAPGIPEHVAREVLVVDYGTPEGLDILKQNMADLAMVLVEPVQSRHPDLQPREFLHQLRKITAEQETALLFDEVITGFRCHLGGAQSHFGVKADLATWGKIIGGGMPIGALTGSAKFMDALDGGCWQYGDASFPEVGVTFFAGTFVRHPLAMAASHAMLSYLKAQGPGLQERLSARTTKFVNELNAFLKARGVPLQVEHFASLFYFHFPADLKHGSLLWFYLREKGIHIWEGRPCFLSTSHTEEDIAYLLQAFKESIIEMQQAGFLPDPSTTLPVLNGRLEFPRLHPTRSEEPNPLPLPAMPAAHARAKIISERHEQPGAVAPARPRKMDFSVYFFGNYDAKYREDKYRIILEGAKFADDHGFKAIWLPERHFHKVGGFSPNPSVIAAALAMQTQNLQLRAGSIVLPLHHPVRVAEEWSVVDNLSGGRVGISIASGWHPDDFVFAPDAYGQRREVCWQGWDIICRLWRGETIEFRTGGQKMLPVRLHPMPKQPEIPAWLTCIHKDSYVKAGELGMGALGYTMNTTLEELADKITAYRDAYLKHGHDPAKANVTILLHTFVGPNIDAARDIARAPMRDYFRAFLDNSHKRIERQQGRAEVAEGDIQLLVDRAFNDYVEGKALIGSPESCAKVVEQMQKMGVDEIGCFLDFGIGPQVVIEHLGHLAQLKRRFDDQPV
jgi:natural product biosynthesis luciferase-like monooxygenase protein